MVFIRNFYRKRSKLLEKLHAVTPLLANLIPGLAGPLLCKHFLHMRFENLSESRQEKQGLVPTPYWPASPQAVTRGTASLVARIPAPILFAYILSTSLFFRLRTLTPQPPMAVLAATVPPLSCNLITTLSPPRMVTYPAILFFTSTVNAGPHLLTEWTLIGRGSGVALLTSKFVPTLHLSLRRVEWTSALP